MSHFLKIKTQIREKDHLVRSLRDLHYRFQEGNNLIVRGYSENRERSEVVVDTGSQYDIGFQRRADAYEIVADWWGVEKDTSIRQESFIQQVNRQYNYNLIMDQAVEQNLVVEKEEILASGDMVIILSERG